MNKMHVSEFCGIAEDGTKADAIGKAFDMFQKALGGEFVMDKSQTIHNHVSVGTVWMFSNLVVDLGFINHPFFIEAWQNVMSGEATTPIGTPHIDSVKGTQTKRSAPSITAYNNYANPGYCWTVMSKRKTNKVWAEKYALNFFNPITSGRHEGTLMITTDQLFALNPQWDNNHDLDREYCVYLPADRNTGKPKSTSKYSSYLKEVA